MNFQYCKCAFHGEYCDNIGMSRGDARDYVDKEYDKWVEGEKKAFEQKCYKDEGIYSEGKCTYCDNDEVVVNNKCVKNENTDELVDEGDDEDVGEELPGGDCKYDSDCDPICEGEVAWKMGCNPRKNECVKTFDNDCSADIENFGDSEVSKTCAEGVCVCDEAAIAELRTELMTEKKIWSDKVKAINATRDDLNTAMLDSNKMCLNGIADMTNLLILEGATRIASFLAGGIPDVAKMTASASDHAAGLMLENTKAFAGSVSDYTGSQVQKVYNYTQGTPVTEEKKLKPHEFIKLNCDLYDYFKAMIAKSDEELDLALEQAKIVDEKINNLTQ